MVDSKLTPATNLKEHRHELAQEITELHFKNHPELEEKYGDKGREKYYEDIVSHINYLEQAVRVNSSALFSNYLDWARTMLKERGIPESNLIESISFMKEAIQQKLKQDDAQKLVEFIDSGLDSLQIHSSQSKTFLRDGEPLAEEAKTYLDLLLGGERKKAADLIEELAEKGESIKDIYKHIFQKTQYEVGALWQNNMISVAHEHFCTAATQLIMSNLYPRIFSVDKKGRKLVACSVADELHEIGIRMVSDFFEMEGWDTHYLGSNMPDEHLVQLLKEEKPDILAISVTMPLHIDRATKLIKKVRENEQTADVKIMVGGYPFSIVPDLWKKIGADASAASAKEAIKIANKLILN
ncbi:cobalamin-dependent protein [Gracilimonas sp. Q87]|uniref:cobalamin-dependent protein n=1 Tax=Gracilimonas sp. Q87 TaxID=3384766 RepID=UPI0039845B6B